MIVSVAPTAISGALFEAPLGKVGSEVCAASAVALLGVGLAS